jgi:hypothetical protein
MKLELSQPILDKSGITFLPGERGPMTLREVCINSLIVPQKVSPDTKQKKYALYKKILASSSAEAIELEVKEVSLLIDTIGEVQQSALIVGQATEMLNK